MVDFGWITSPTATWDIAWGRSAAAEAVHDPLEQGEELAAADIITQHLPSAGRTRLQRASVNDFTAEVGERR